MTTIGVVQARTGSTRLPGKVLADLGGEPLLAFMLRRLRPIAVDRLVVATSDDRRDDAVAAVAERAGVAVVRGPEDDVLARFAIALDAHPADTVVRLTADCPLVDPDVVDEALALHRRSGAAYTSNTLIRTFPDGLDVEVVSADALTDAASHATARRTRRIPRSGST
jgi:spore coat polysaccharide biosynthesis protein SpsF